MSQLNKVQQASLYLIQGDARLLFSILKYHQYTDSENMNNFLMMYLPYIGMFVDGSSKWLSKVNLNPISLNDEEK